MNRRLLTALGASALIVATVMPAGVTGGPTAPRGSGEALRARRRQQDRQVADQGDPADHDVNVIVEMRGPSASTLDGPKVRQVADRQAAQGPPGRPRRAPSASSAERSRRSTSTPTTASRCASRAASSRPWPGCRASRRSTRSATYTVDNRHSVPFIGAPAVWQDFGDHRQRPDDRRHRHRHRLHPRQLRRRRAPRPAYDDNDSDVIEPGTFPTAKVIAGWDFVGDATTRATTTGPRSRPRTPTRSTATATARTSPARAAGLRRQVGPHDLHRPLQLDHLLDLVRHRPGRRAEGQARRR